MRPAGFGNSSRSIVIPIYSPFHVQSFLHPETCRSLTAEATIKPARQMLSIIVPCHNESANISPLFQRLMPILDALDMECEVVCVNDGSRDDTMQRLVAANVQDPRIRVVDLSRNFGKELALSAGLSFASGAAVIPMDADLQHPPEAIPILVARWREGFEVVNAVRRERVGQSAMSRTEARLFYWLFEKISDTPLPREVGDFRLLDRKVVDVINRMPERTRFMKGIFAWVGFRQAEVPYDQGPRHSGAASTSTLRLLRLALDGFTAFSNAPLRIWSLLGAVIAGLAFFYI